MELYDGIIFMKKDPGDARDVPRAPWDLGDPLGTPLGPQGTPLVPGTRLGPPSTPLGPPGTTVGPPGTPMDHKNGNI